MTTLYVALEDALLVLRESPRGWAAEQHLQGRSPSSLAVHHGRPDHVYAGTHDRGLWRSRDGGRTWQPAGDGIASADVSAVAATPELVLAGTEPSAVFRSTDAGDTWEELAGLRALPSSGTWSFPPRPETHHVRSIAIDGRTIHVAVEAGALVRSPDGGRTWIDRTPDGPYDTHTLVVHPRAPGRLFSAAGDGSYESRDGGASWARSMSGLRHGYLVGAAVDPVDPEAVIVSAAPGPHVAYTASRAESHVYARRDGEWTEIAEGLPAPNGTTVSSFASSRLRPGVHYAGNNRGIFRTADASRRWERLDVPWPERAAGQSVRALALVEGDPGPTS